MPGSPSFFFFNASRMSSGTIPFIWLSSDDSWNSLMSAAMTMAVVVRLMPAWQLNTMGVDAVVSLSSASTWSKQPKSGAVSWFSGMRSASTLLF